MVYLLTTSQSLYGTALLKAKEILDYIATSKSSPTLKEISENVSPSKPTVLKLLQTLQYCGYVTCDPESKKYFLGTIFLRYASTISLTHTINLIAKPYLAKLRDVTQETVNLGIIEHNEVILLNKLESPNSIKLVSRIGGAMKMYSSAMGKSILSEYDEDRLKDYLKKVPLEPVTKNTITSKKELLADLESVRKNGYALEKGENQPEVICVGFSLVKDGRVYGTMSISTPWYRVNKESLAMFIREGKKKQQEILNHI